MASQHIDINGAATRLNIELRRAIDALWAARNANVQIKAKADQLVVGADWAALATALGLESAANAETVYNLLAGIQDDLTGSDVSNFLSRLG